ncbi:MAG: choline dehydrogenase [Chromatiales bacterium]|nr:choline dehydrogenase [Chromatiales bacterium]
MNETFDYIIVGTGTAGSVIAHRLCEDIKTQVCVLEAGGRDTNPFIHIPAGFMKTITDPSVNWLYETLPSEGTAGRRIGQPRGKTLGGSSSINGHIYNRGQRMDFDVWAQMGNRGWSYADVLPYFKRSERRVGDGDDKFRGREGQYVIEDLEWEHPLCDAFMEGATSLGIPRNADYNGEAQEGVGFFQRSIHKGLRQSSARSYLYPAMGKGNLTVKTKAMATSLILEGKRVVGVRFRQGGVDKEVRARREVIVSGGTFNSPQLLQLSGIGPAPLLNELGIPVLHELPGVGENLRDHYPVRMAARAKNISTINEKSRGLPLAWEVIKYLVARKGILTLQPTLVACFWKSDENLESGDLQMTFTPASYAEGVQSDLEQDPGMTIAVWQQRPESTGYVRARSPDPMEKPDIQPNYLADDIDQRALLGGIKLGRRLFRTEALAPYFEQETSPGDGVDTDEQLLNYARERGTTAFHPMGTCRMGPAADRNAVVDDQLRVHGLEGLRVADASIMPTMPSANTNASTLMIGEKAGDLIRGRPALPPVEL